MGQFTESLTIRILGESSGLQQELETAARAIEEFEERLGRIAEWSDQLGEVMNGLGNTEGLEGVNRALERIRQQMQIINNTPLVINVAPALANLAMVSAALDVILMKILAIRALGAGGGMMMGGGGGAGGGGGGGGFGGGVQEFASGGLVSGPGGIDRVPALLTAGEFVMSSSSVRELGAGFLRGLNENPLQAKNETRGRGLREAWRGGEGMSTRSQSGAERMFTETSRQEVTHVGGVTIHVHQEMDAEGVLRHLRLQGTALRNRRG